MNERLSAHLIRPGDLNPGWVLLYAATWALQCVQRLVSLLSPPCWCW